MYYWVKETKWQKELVKKIAKEKGIDERVVRKIVYHPLSFVRDVMKTDEDKRPIRVRHLGAFALKKKYNNEDNI